MRCRHFAAPVLIVLLIATGAGCARSPAPTPVCTLTIAPASHALPADGGTRTVTVTASSASCAWTATTAAGWIGLTPTSSGTGSGSFDYTVAATPETTQRSATILIGEQTHTVTQAGRDADPPPPPVCSYTLTPDDATVGAAGGTGAVQVGTASGCAWTALSSDTWLAIEDGSTGSGPGVVRYRAAAYDGTTRRTGTMTIAGRTFTLTQDGIDTSTCSYSVSPVTFDPCLLAGSVTTQVQTTANCPWTVTSTAPWLSIDGAAARTGAGDVRMTFPSNYAAPREGVIEIRWPTTTAGQNVRVAQAGCLYATSASTMAVAAAGGALTFDVLQQAMPNSCGGPLQDACVWSATTGASWITITSTMPKRGDASVALTVAPNTTAQARAATIVVQDRVVTIEQAGTVP